MAKKLKCGEDEMVSWSVTAKHGEKIQPDGTKMTLAQQKKARGMALNDPKGCVPKPKGRAIAEITKRRSKWYRDTEEATGTKFKDLD